jgi:hypothetical protein
LSENFNSHKINGNSAKTGKKYVDISLFDSRSMVQREILSTIAKLNKTDATLKQVAIDLAI